MKTFKINYISRYREQKEHCSEIIKAQSEESALKKFAKMFHIKDYTQFFEEHFHWEDSESEWLSWFRGINEVELVKCLHCNGTGQIKIEK
jgi:hypothetical protein